MVCKALMLSMVVLVMTVSQVAVAMIFLSLAEKADKTVLGTLQIMRISLIFPDLMALIL